MFLISFETPKYSNFQRNFKLISTYVHWIFQRNIKRMTQISESCHLYRLFILSVPHKCIYMECSMYLHYSVRKLCRGVIACDQEHLCSEMFIEHISINCGGFFLSLNFSYFRTDVKLSLQQLFILSIKQHHFGWHGRTKRGILKKYI